MFVVRDGDTARIVAAHPETNDLDTFGEAFPVHPASIIELFHDEAQSRVIVYETWLETGLELHSRVRAGERRAWRIWKDVTLNTHRIARDLSFFAYSPADGKSTTLASFSGADVHTFVEPVLIDAIADDGRAVAFRKRGLDAWTWTPESGERHIDGQCQPFEIYETSLLAACADDASQRWSIRWFDRATAASLPIAWWRPDAGAAGDNGVNHPTVENDEIVVVGDRGSLVKLGRIPDGLSASDVRLSGPPGDRFVVTNDGGVFDFGGALIGRVPVSWPSWSLTGVARTSTGVVVLAAFEQQRDRVEAWRNDRDTPIPVTVPSNNRYHLTRDGRFVLRMDGDQLVFDDLDRGTTGVLVARGAEDVARRHAAY